MLIVVRGMPVFDAPYAHAQADRKSATLTKSPETAGVAAFKGKEQGKILDAALYVLCAFVCACAREDRLTLFSTLAKRTHLLTLTHAHLSNLTHVRSPTATQDLCNLHFGQL